MAPRKKTPQILDAESPQTPPLSPPRKRSSRRSTKKPASQPALSTETPLSPLSQVAVSLSVTAPAQLADTIRAYLSQAFDAFLNVQLVDTGADWNVVVLGVGIQTTAHDTDGVALSVTIVQALDVSARGAEAPLVPTGLFHDAWLRLGASADLERLCRQIAANFHDRYVSVLWAQAQQDHSPTQIATALLTESPKTRPESLKTKKIQ